MQGCSVTRQCMIHATISICSGSDRSKAMLALGGLARSFLVNLWLLPFLSQLTESWGAT
jgi:hypothetical protein